MMQDLPAVEDLLEAADDAPIIRMLNALLTQAAKDGASDIHIEPYERSSSGALPRRRHAARGGAAQQGAARGADQPAEDHGRAGHRRKAPAAGRPHLAAHRRPRHRRARLHAAQRRTANAPCCACWTRPKAKFTLEGLGMDGDVLQRFDRLVQQPHGIVLVTGPTGSGKTTTLYASLGRVDTATTNVLTVEDPVEYELPGIGQTQVNPKIDLTFAKALRAILRQDPDVIMIGEIRDHETAQIAIQASLTGHLVLATVHTNDAPSSVTRLIDMGVEPFLLSSSLLGVLAQRLVRKLCPNASTQDDHGPLAPGGLRHCSHTGYKGRTGVYELMVVDDKLRSLIHSRAANRPDLRGRGAAPAGCADARRRRTAGARRASRR
jgi:general secretion pathway protein E